MSCEVVREALPLLTGSDENEATRVREHVAGCAPCRELMASYEADVAALAHLRLAQQGSAPIMSGFSEQLLDRLTHESRHQPRAEVLVLSEARGSNLRWLAAAAAVLLVVTTAFVLRSPLESATPAVADRQPSPAVVTPDDDAPQLAAERLAPLPAPSAADSAPMPLRRVGRPVNPEVLPADGRAGAPRGAGALELQELMQRALPGLRRFFPPPERPTERDGEVSF